MASGLVDLFLLIPAPAAGSIELSSTALSECASSVADSPAQLQMPLSLNIASDSLSRSKTPSPEDWADTNLFWSDVAVDACQRSKLRRIESVDAVSVSIAKAGGNWSVFDAT